MYAMHRCLANPIICSRSEMSWSRLSIFTFAVTVRIPSPLMSGRCSGGTPDHAVAEPDRISGIAAKILKCSHQMRNQGSSSSIADCGNRSY